MIAPVASLVLVLAAADGETVVHARAADDVDVARIDAVTPWDGGAALLLVPGAALARDGGPLAPVRPVLRGLSGPRLDVRGLGIPLNDPAAGVVDLGLLPWGIGDAVVDVGAGAGLGGSVALRRPRPGTDVVFGAGSLATLRARARTTTAVEHGHAVGFVDVGSTRGDFVFDNDDTLGTGGPPAVRRNNDQQRLNAALAADVSVQGLRVDVAAVAGARRGGIPGFATAPLALRAEDALGGVGARIRAHPGPIRFDAGIDATGSDRRVTGDGGDSRLVGSRVGANARIAAAVVPGTDVALAVRADHSGLAGIVVRDVARIDGELHTRHPLGTVVLGLDVRVGWGVVADRDDGAAPEPLSLPQAGLRLALADTAAALTGFVGVARASRAPTLDERFAPRGFYRGNPALRPEFVDELEAGIAIAGPAARVRVVGHASALRDVIVIVHKNAFEVTSENTGAATRTGVDLGVVLHPTRLLSVDLSASLLASALSATGAPLPAAPPVTLALAPRLGDEATWIRALGAVRGPVSSTLFGTLTSPGSALLDLAGRVPLGTGLGALVTVQNVLDVRDARDQNLLPLPGRLLFVSLEVRT